MIGELELVTLKITPTQARMLATAASARGIHYAEMEWDSMAQEYADLATEVDRQRRL